MGKSAVFFEPRRLGFSGTHSLEWGLCGHSDPTRRRSPKSSHGQYWNRPRLNHGRPADLYWHGLLAEISSSKAAIKLSTRRRVGEGVVPVNVHEYPEKVEASLRVFPWFSDAFRISEGQNISLGLRRRG